MRDVFTYTLHDRTVEQNVILKSRKVYSYKLTSKPRYIV